MKLVEINWNPTIRQLRQFALVCLVALPLVGWLWEFSLAVVAGLAAAGAVLCLLGWVCPWAVKPLFLAISIATAPIGMVLGELAMLLVYVGVFLPIGICFRLGRRDFSATADRPLGKIILATKKAARRAGKLLSAVVMWATVGPREPGVGEKNVSQEIEPQSGDAKSAFEKLGEEKQMSLAREFWLFVRENKKWWLIPILLVFALVGLLVVLGSTGAAPFIYTLF